MPSNRDPLLADLETIALAANHRLASLQAVADLLRNRGNYRWVGLYDVDYPSATVRIIVWSGSSAPQYPQFPITQGLTAAAISDRKTVRVGDVAADPRYLTAFGTTRSEIIVPIFGQEGRVVGTIDVESEQLDAFDDQEQTLLEACSRVIRPFWSTAPAA